MIKLVWKLVTFLTTVKDIFNIILDSFTKFFGDLNITVIIIIACLLVTFSKEFDSHEQSLRKFKAIIPMVAITTSLLNCTICLLVNFLAIGNYEFHPLVDSSTILNIIFGVLLYGVVGGIFCMLLGLAWLGANIRNTQADITRRFAEITS